MDRAKEAVSGFLHKSGNKDTTVHETIAPAVTQETVVPTRREDVQTAVDKEVHQDHYHTSIQPVADREVLPEKHVHQVGGVEERAIQHGNPKDDAALAAREAGQFKDARVVSETQHSAGAAQTVQGEHVHHHVYETIQPVVNKETVQPEVVHTVRPVHEVHQNESQHHGTTQLPGMTRAEMEAKGIPLGGRDARYDSFQGEPRLAAGGVPPSMGSGTTSSTNTSSAVPVSGSSAATTSQPANGGLGSSTLEPVGSQTNPLGSHHLGQSTETTGTSSTRTEGAPGYESGSTSQSKPSLMDKLNPKVDATGDGKPGFMK